MSLSLIGQATGVNSATLPSFAAGDLALCFAFRDGSTTAPSLPAGWVNIGNNGANTCSGRIGYRLLLSGDTTTGTWTNATSVVVQIYRSSLTMAYVGGFNTSGAASTTVTYNTVTMKRGDGTSWVAGFAGHRSTNTALENAPTGMTNRATVVDATDEAAGHDTNGGVASWSSTNVSVGGSSSGWRSYTVEIVEAVVGDLVQSIIASATASATSIASGLLSVRAGNLLVVGTSWGTSDRTPTVADTLTNTFAEIGTHLWDPDSNILMGLALFYAKDVTGGADTAVTVSFGGTCTERVIIVAEFYGMHLTAPLDQTTGQNAQTAGAASDNATAGSITPSVNGCVIVTLGYAISANPSVAPGSGYTSIREVEDLSTLVSTLMEFLLQGTAASQAGHYTVTTADGYGARVASFKPAGGTEFTQGTADTLGLTEAVTRQAQKAVAETVALTETLTRQAARAILETIVLTEALPRQITRPLAETLSLSEDLAALKIAVVDIPETVSLSEQLAMAVAKRSDLAETLGLTEQLARQTGKSLAETVSLVENLTAIKAIFKDLAETVTLTENLGRVIQKAADLAEAVGLAEELAKQTNRTVAETLGLSENLVAIKVAQKDVADTVALSETVTRLMARVLEEQVGLSEAQVRQTRKMLAETIGFTEQLVATVIHAKEVTEAVSLTEAQTRQIGKAIQETLGLTETRFVSLARRMEETVNLQEVLDVLFVPSTPAIAVVGFKSLTRLVSYRALPIAAFVSLGRQHTYVARESVVAYPSVRVVDYVSVEDPA